MTMLQEQIQHFSQQIQDRYSPEKIILFGSQARKDARKDSDVDLLVVIDHDGKNAYLAAEIRTELRPSFPIDLLVRRPSDIEERVKLGDRFIHEILEQGSILYDRYRS
jgi:predicted nucleotidyltransferase